MPVILELGTGEKEVLAIVTQMFRDDQRQRFTRFRAQLIKPYLVKLETRLKLVPRSDQLDSGIDSLRSMNLNSDEGSTN